MSSFYGTNVISHIPRSNFKIDHIFPNALKMFQTITEDKVPIYGYVLVDYNHPNENYIDDGQTGLYQFNNNIDQIQWGSDSLIINYDQTVWQKVLNYNDILVYRAIARLNSILPDFTGPADYFIKKESIPTMQRLNAMPFTQKDIPRTYNDFGITSLNTPMISFDKASIDKFNERYPAEKNEIIMEMHDKHQLSKENSAIFGERIAAKIKDLEDSSENSSYYSEMYQWYNNEFLPTLTLSVSDCPENLTKFSSNTVEYPTK